MLEDTSIPVRLSEGLLPGGSLKKSAVVRGLITLERLTEKYDLRNKKVKAVATAVLRMASNPEVFTGPAREIIGQEIEIISGIEEARLLALGAMLHLDHIPTPRVVLDIGGQSTEVVWQEPDGNWLPLSLSVGVVGLTERFFPSKRIAPYKIEKMSDFVLDRFAEAIPNPREGHLVGVAGTITTLAMLQLETREWVRDRVHGLCVTEQAVEKWLATMARLTPQERTIKHGISAGRADVFPAGLVVLRTFMQFFKKSEMTVSANGLRVGVALKLLEVNG